MTETGEGGNGVLRYRVENNSKRIDRIEEWRTVVDEDRTALKGELKNVHDDLVEIRETQKTFVKGLESNNRRQLQVMATIATSAVIYAISTLAATGKIG